MRQERTITSNYTTNYYRTLQGSHKEKKLQAI